MKYEVTVEKKFISMDIELEAKTEAEAAKLAIEEAEGRDWEQYDDGFTVYNVMELE